MPGKQKQGKRAHLEYLSVPKIFDQLQISVANHQKNCVALHKIHSNAARFCEDVDNGRSVKLTGEKMFEEIVQCMLFHVLPLKKGTTTADRVVRFIGAFIKIINEKGK
jgi:condensin complex subunit 3